MTLAKLAQDAIDVQDACNLSGVARSLHEACQTLRENGVTDTDAINTHAITRMFVAKLSHLAGTQWVWSDEIMDAYHECQRLAKAGA